MQHQTYFSFLTPSSDPVVGEVDMLPIRDWDRDRLVEFRRNGKLRLIPYAGLDSFEEFCLPALTLLEDSSSWFGTFRSFVLLFDSIKIHEHRLSFRYVQR
jgi:hypothetical protein